MQIFEMDSKDFELCHICGENSSGNIHTWAPKNQKDLNVPEGTKVVLALSLCAECERKAQEEGVPFFKRIVVRGMVEIDQHLQKRTKWQNSYGLQ
ncbi:MAG: hypothetical protein K9K64_09980 [Desulfohalobiaceae bacterium]|nr:hypothetical protein [Desulfohalobiaceae bacterium]